MDFKTVCKNGCPAILGVGGRKAMPMMPEQPAGPTTPKMSIPEIATSNPDFSTLLAALSAAELVEALSADGPFTVFAPNNDAFAKVPSDALSGLLADKDALTAVLARHVVAGSMLKVN